ncbi:MAG: RNase H, partial [Lachnospiraceae bacterium]|nr:RNase H [Lachnospiraceae bacterium]
IAYAEFYRKASAKVHIQFAKVRGHSGDTYNELADQLAKGALGIA